MRGSQKFLWIGGMGVRGPSDNFFFEGGGGGGSEAYLQEFYYVNCKFDKS